MQALASSRLLSTRGGTIILGAIAAGFAALLLIVYLNGYRNSVRAGGEPGSVLVARTLIPKGTSGTVIGTKDLFQTAQVRQADLKEGALADPATIRGRVALTDIYPGQQLTAGDFTVATTEALPTQITGAHRAIAVAIDASHGLIGHLQTGDRVDVYVGLNGQNNGVAQPVLRLLIPNVQVLAVPVAAGGGLGATAGSNVVLRVKTAEAARVAFAADNGKLWFILRPQSGATATKPDLVTVQRLLLGTPPVNVSPGS